MRIKLDKAMKIQLLKAIQCAELDTEIFPEFRGYESARVLTREEALDLWNDLENGKFQNIISSHETNQRINKK